MPATTMVAAWISAETGVGPAIASGSHVWRMNWPDFDITAVIRQHDARRRSPWEIPPSAARMFMSRIEKVLPAAKNRMITPMSRPMSPTRLVRNAFSAASEFGLSSHQCPMSTNEQTPTNSQPMIIWINDWDRTKKSIDAVNRLRNAK